MSSQNVTKREYTADKQAVLVMIIDHQEKLLPHICGHEAILTKACKLLEFRRLLSLPTIVTEQYPQGLGPTVPEIARLLDESTPILRKMTFSCLRTDEITEAVREHGQPRVVVSGIETHICVGQTVLDLLSASLSVHVLADCVGSRAELDHEVALQRMRDAGAVITTLEAFMFETLRTCEHPMFRKFNAQIMKR